MTDNPREVIIPELNITSNDGDLRTMQKKMLAYILSNTRNYYSKQIKDH